MAMALLPSLNTCKRRIRSPFSWADSLPLPRGSSRKQAVNVSAPPHHWGLLRSHAVVDYLWPCRHLNICLLGGCKECWSLRKPVEPLLTVRDAKSRFSVKYSPNPNLWSKLDLNGKTMAKFGGASATRTVLYTSFIVVMGPMADGQYPWSSGLMVKYSP